MPHASAEMYKAHNFLSNCCYLPIITGMGGLIILNEFTITEIIRVINAYPGRRDGKL